MYDINKPVRDPKGLIESMEKSWNRTRFTLYLSPSQESMIIGIGREKELQNVPASIPTVGIIGNYLYRMDPTDERIIEVVRDTKNGKDYVRLEYETDKNSFIELLSGMSFIANSRSNEN